MGGRKHDGWSRVCLAGLLDEQHGGGWAGELHHCDGHGRRPRPPGRDLRRQREHHCGVPLHLPAGPIGQTLRDHAGANAGADAGTDAPADVADATPNAPADAGADAGAVAGADLFSDDAGAFINADDAGAVAVADAPADI